LTPALCGLHVTQTKFMYASMYATVITHIDIQQPNTCMQLHQLFVLIGNWPIVKRRLLADQ